MSRRGPRSLIHPAGRRVGGEAKRHIDNHGRLVVWRGSGGAACLALHAQRYRLEASNPPDSHPAAPERARIGDLSSLGDGLINGPAAGAPYTQIARRTTRRRTAALPARFTPGGTWARVSRSAPLPRARGERTHPSSDTLATGLDAARALLPTRVNLAGSSPDRRPSRDDVAGSSPDRRPSGDKRCPPA